MTFQVGPENLVMEQGEPSSRKANLNTKPILARCLCTR